MKIKCLHGYFKFWEPKAGVISDFSSLFGFDLVSIDDYFTFSALEDAPRYSIIGGTYLGATATKTFEGDPWEVMRENNLVYDFAKDVIVPIASIVQKMQLDSTNRYFLSNGMILPGSLTDDGTRVTDYAAFFINPLFKYSEVIFE